MSWESVARGDIRHLRRSRMGQAVAVLLLLSTVGVVALAIILTLINRGTQMPKFADVMLFIAALLSFLLPVVALVGSYGAIISERKMGSIRFLLGLPNSRADAYLGKFVSRSLLVLAPLAAGIVISAVVGAVFFRQPSLFGFLGLLVPSILYAMIFVGFGLTISAAVDTETRAVVGIVAVMVFFRGIWTGVQWLGLQITSGQEFVSQPYPAWYYLLGRLNPINAFTKVTNAVIHPDVTNPLITAPESAAAAPFTGLAFAAFAILLWLAIAPWIGYVRFRDKDLP